MDRGPDYRNGDKPLESHEERVTEYDKTQTEGPCPRFHPRRLGWALGSPLENGLAHRALLRRSFSGFFTAPRNRERRWQSFALVILSPRELPRGLSGRQIGRRTNRRWNIGVARAWIAQALGNEKFYPDSSCIDRTRSYRRRAGPSRTGRNPQSRNEYPGRTHGGNFPCRRQSNILGRTQSG